MFSPFLTLTCFLSFFGRAEFFILEEKILSCINICFYGSVLLFYFDILWILGRVLTINVAARSVHLTCHVTVSSCHVSYVIKSFLRLLKIINHVFWSNRPDSLSSWRWVILVLWQLRLNSGKYFFRKSVVSLNNFQKTFMCLYWDLLSYKNTWSWLGPGWETDCGKSSRKRLFSQRFRILHGKLSWVLLWLDWNTIKILSVDSVHFGEYCEELRFEACAFSGVF